MRLFSLLFLFLGTTAFANVDNAKLSEALGHMIGKNLQSLDVPLDLEAIAKGLQDQAAGLSSPMTEDVCVQALIKLQEEQNLNEALSFLDANRKREGVVALEEGKLQYEILKKGEGEQVQLYNSPLVRLKNEKDIFESSPKDEILALDETITGLKLGIIGMKEGEVRKLYIHPDLAFKESHRLDPHNYSLLIFEVEILKADASSEAHASSNAESLSIFQDLDDVRPFTR